MAVRQISQTDSLEKLRIEFNALAATDFGDIATLDSSIAATSIVAMNETIALVSAARAFIVDETSTRQLIGSGQELQVRGTTNEVTVAVQATDTMPESLPADVNISSSLTVVQALVHQEIFQQQVRRYKNKYN